ncbi:hypothetical protein LAJ55_15970, partial [Streptococcus pneumoniae]|uniref:hypothetical protein n=1 Tax=Streptococcus pneumoniae TaxID=1313 RepID=UPI001CBD91CE
VRFSNAERERHRFNGSILDDAVLIDDDVPLIGSGWRYIRNGYLFQFRCVGARSGLARTA